MSTKQFSDVNCSRGAPMGRRSSPLNPPVRLFRVKLDPGGYDDGGAYWGIEELPLWCARDEDGDEQFIRAETRTLAAHFLFLHPNQLKCQRNVARMNRVKFQNGSTTRTTLLDDKQIVAWGEFQWIKIQEVTPLQPGEDL